MNLATATPKELVGEMLLAGARFAVHRRSDELRVSFTYSLEPGADRERCRAILAAAKQRPAPFFTAFQAEVQRVVAETTGGRS